VCTCQVYTAKVLLLHNPTVSCKHLILDQLQREAADSADLGKFHALAALLLDSCP
jgi:hypothetical protein